MSCYIRPQRPGATIFFTLCLARQGDDLLVARIDALRAAFRATMSDYPFRIEACVILPDHLHCIWTLPPQDCEFAMRWRLIKGRFVQGLDPRPRSRSKRRKSEKGIWQRRFWEHHIRDAGDFARHVAYCHQDPVRHGLVAQAACWPYSTIHRHEQGAGIPVVPVAAERAGEFPAGAAS